MELMDLHFELKTMKLWMCVKADVTIVTKYYELEM